MISYRHGLTGKLAHSTHHVSQNEEKLTCFPFPIPRSELEKIRANPISTTRQAKTNPFPTAAQRSPRVPWHGKLLQRGSCQRHPWLLADHCLWWYLSLPDWLPSAYNACPVQSTVARGGMVAPAVRTTARAPATPGRRARRRPCPRWPL